MRFSPLLLAALALGLACANDASSGEAPIQEGACALEAAAPRPAFLARLGCQDDFNALASEPLDSSIPGARSVKVVLDQFDNDTLYFQDSTAYAIHYAFVSTNLSGAGKPLVGSLADFNQTEYSAPDRRFLLGSVTYYEGPDVWALEIAPYDTASAALMTKLYGAVRQAGFFGPSLFFHPTSQAVAAEAKKLAASVPVKTTDALFAAIDYQPLNLASSIGRLRFVNAADLEKTYLSYRDIVVLDRVPNDISVVLGLITEEFQTPLSHVNVLSQNRKTPNMGLRNAMANTQLRALDGKWVRLTVGAFTWNITEVTGAEADAYWETHKPAPVQFPAADLTVTGLRDIGQVVTEGSGSLRDAIKRAIPAFGGKAAHYAVLANTPGLPVRQAFVVPAAYYVQFMEENGFYERLDRLMADPAFQEDPAVRDARLKEFRDAMEQAPVNAGFQALLKAKMAADYPGLPLRFRTSTNSEDLEGFPCAGCYESHTGDPSDWEDVLDAIRETWASIWLFRTFEERAYSSIDHTSVVMALLVHHNFPDEEANGVALTANPFDPSGLQPGLYVNVQAGGDAEVVHPPPGITSDQFIYAFHQPGLPLTYLSHSNLVKEGETVLTPAQVFELGKALDAIHERFSPAYGPRAGNTGWYAMDVEFKFDAEPGQVPTLTVKQARPHPGRGQ
ncbi:Pyruvate phosphate dikinase, PEP/pyruvate binding domain [Stigmatella aurantiaca]|uniref:Phosphoenolpyruvate synthase n=1 Tax=Stigmatella aurantiaca TaxID=41 RepID=A0A1H8E8Q7_STIAU|nr:PEP/pyruvate-binding domain-containing protein [Stigmatella aurantiaca]SEN15909.1 Pyruvate phosphate dikinase, PEP/pyruvate binding domain [Stigmatella aurantiaca]